MQSGFRNYFESEAEKGSLPKVQNSPQKPPMGLFAEQLSGSSFTSPREHNLRSWLYKHAPSAGHSEYKPFPSSISFNFEIDNPTQMRWKPYPYSDAAKTFLDSLAPYVGNGIPSSQAGSAIFMYAFNKNMSEYFYSADGELLFLPQEGHHVFKTEFGILEADPTEIVVIPRGVKFQLHTDKKARGYLCENFGAPFQLPELGPIGSNGLANPRDFYAPNAWYEKTGSVQIVAKYQSQLFVCEAPNSPLNVVAWHGNYYPYKYDLKKFNTINTVSFDHPDPSIFTVLTSPSGTPGVANLDFVIFPPRWMVAEDTFRPPYYHRNIMSEFMGLIHGVYDAKSDEFSPGGASLHNCMSAHGPDKQTHKKATDAELKPERYKDTLAFMLESRYPFQISKWAFETNLRDKNYLNCWL